MGWRRWAGPTGVLMDERHKGSLFSQKLDRAAFTAYFLGAVVPLVALAVVVDQFVLPDLTDRIATIGLISLVISVGLLSFASFLVLRHMTRRSLTRMNRDNDRLATLLTLSSKLAGAQHLHEATMTTAARALEIAEADAAFVLLRGEGDKEPTLAETAGRTSVELYPQLEESLGDLVALVMEQGRPASKAPGGDSEYATLVVPLPGERGALGAVAVARSTRAFGTDEIDGLSTLAGLAAVSLSNADLRDAQRNFFSHMTDILVTALDSHLGYNQGHGQRVAQYANRMGRALDLDEARLQNLHFAALLHDIGMLKLDRAEQLDRRTCDKHTTLGFRMLSRIRLWKDVAPIVQHHHEWWDGSGYPEGISEVEIPIEARIIAICDAFDTMTHDKSYRATLTLDEAIAEIRAGIGTQFDPNLSEKFLGLIEQGVIEIEQ